MKHKDIHRSRTFWSFLNGVAENNEGGLPVDENHAKAFADFLQDNNDPRWVVAANAKFNHMANTDPHPSLPGDPAGDVLDRVYGWRGDYLEPVESHRVNAHTSVGLFVKRREGEPPAPIINWRTHIPRTVSSTGKSRTAVLSAPVTVAELHTFIDQLHPLNRAQWRRAADKLGWSRPVKLSRDYAPLVRAVKENEQEGTLHHMLADYLEENDIPGAGVVRAHADRLTYGGPTRIQVLYPGQFPRAYDASHIVILGMTPRHIASGPRKQIDDLTQKVPAAQVYLPSDGPNAVLATLHQDPEQGSIVHWAHTDSYERLAELMHDFPPWARTKLLKYASTRLKPTKLARVTLGPGGGAARETMSGSHDSRLAVARQVMREAGLRAAVRPAIAGRDGETRPSAVIMIDGSAGIDHVKYAAAWHGLLSGEPALQVFHPGEGKDTLHVIDAPHPTEAVVAAANAHGLPSFAVERRAAGSRLFSTHPSDLTPLARSLDASYRRTRGTVARVGNREGPGPAARADYRSTIRAAEDTGPAS